MKVYCYSLVEVFFQGNAPSADRTVFAADTVDRTVSGADNVTAYYYSGTTGWNTFTANSGVPALPWLPTIQTADGSLGVQNSQFGFNVTGPVNMPIVVEACTNLGGGVWTPLTNVLLTNGMYYFSDAQWTNYPGRYYFISSP
ncbi:MAG: Cell surface protein [Pedosphaera sp.]|nr:Cell surface protein [Pedosphaera sp.]